MLVRELVTRLGFQVDENGLRRYESGVNNARATTERAGAAMRAALAGVAAFGIGRMLSGLTEAAQRVQGLQARLAALSQGGDFDQLADRARSLGADMSSYIEGYAQLANATDGVLASQAEVTDVLDTLNAGLKLSGADAGTAAGVMRQFGQALGSGALRGDELNSMNEGAGVLMRELSRAILGPNGTVGALKQMAGQGKLTTDVVLAAMRQIGPTMQAQANGMGRTVGQAAQGLRDTFDRVLARMDDAVGLTRRLRDAMDWMSNGVERAIEFLGGMDTIVHTVGISLGVLAATRLPAVVAGLTAMARAAVAAFAPFLPAVAAVGAVLLAVQDLYMWVNGQESLAGTLLGPFEDVANSVRSMIERIRLSITDLIEDVVRLWERVQTFDGLKSVAGNAAVSAANALGDATGLSSIGRWIGGKAADAADWIGGRGAQTVNASTVINVHGNPSQQTLNEIGAITERSVRGAMSEAARR